MTRRMAIAAVLALSMGGLPLLAQGPGQRGGPGRGRQGGPGAPGGPPGIFAMIHQLDLTDAQREQLRALMEDGRQGGDPGATVREAEQRLHAAVLADTPDLQAIESLKAVLNAAHAGELEHRVEMMQKVAQILTPAQRQQLLKMPPPEPPRGRGPVASNPTSLTQMLGKPIGPLWRHIVDSPCLAVFERDLEQCRNLNMMSVPAADRCLMIRVKTVGGFGKASGGTSATTGAQPGSSSVSSS